MLRATATATSLPLPTTKVSKVNSGDKRWVSRLPAAGLLSGTAVLGADIAVAAGVAGAADELLACRCLPMICSALGVCLAAVLAAAAGAALPGHSLLLV